MNYNNLSGKEKLIMFIALWLILICGYFILKFFYPNQINHPKENIGTFDNYRY